MTMELRPYPEYKDSGLPRLGLVPAHWRMATLRRVADVQLSNVDKHSFQGEQPVRLCNYTDVYYHRYITPDMDFMKATALPREIEKFELRRGDVLITKDSEDWQDIAVPALVTEDIPGILCGYHLAHIKPWADELHGDYLMWACRSEPVALQFRTVANGVTRYAVSGPDIKGALVPLPPLDEQYAIGRYLRSIERRVNRFIRNRRRLIEVLNEQNQAIINRAVTRGLDPNVRLKPSGINWLGDIPEHWHVKPLKRWASANQRVLSESTDPDYMFDYLDIGCVGTGILIGRPSRMRLGEAPSRARRVLQRGDTIISTVRTYLRAVYFVAEDVSDLIASTGFAVLTPREGVVPEYLGITLQSDSFINRVTANSIGIAYPAIAETRLGTFHVALPPTAGEQQAIVSQVRNETAALTAWIERTQREIDLIREYRTRLIADVVTGKVDVRQAAAARAAKQTRKPANVHFRRSVFAAEIVHRLHDEPTFGHVKFEKMIFLCEKRCGVDTGSTYRRQAAGPYDNRALRSIDSQIKKQKWYAAQKHDKGYRYAPLEKAGGHTEYFNRYFADVATQFDETIDTFRKARTVQCEIVATLYAAWEDLLVEGEVTDDQVIEQVLHRWHPSKQKIAEDRWRTALGWMKKKGLTPEAGVTSGSD